MSGGNTALKAISERKNGLLLRIVASVIILVATAAAGLISRPTQAAIAVAQLRDDRATYGIAQWIAAGGGIGLVSVIGIVLLVALWVPWIIRKTKRMGLLGAMALMLLAAGCLEPKEQVETIAPNETAFLIPLEGAPKADQGKFMSEDFLNAAKVATKRITVPIRKLDRSNDWVPLVLVVKVDRTPIVREWVAAADKGTSKSNQAIAVESRESIDFTVGVNASASITEDDAAKFLYYFNSKTLAEVMDSNVREYIQSQLFNEFGARPLESVRAEKGTIFTAIEQRTKEFFRPMGVTVQYVGGAEGLTYRDASIQTAINQVFQANQDKVKAQQEYEAQQVRNLTIVEKARADADARQLQGAALLSNPRLVDLEAIQKWDGKLPQYNGGPIPFVTVPSR